MLELKTTTLETTLCSMVAIADDNALYALEFFTKKRFEREVERLKQRGFIITPGKNAILTSITQELTAYLKGTLTTFTTPYRALGSPFQQAVWQALTEIPYGETRSYADQARSLNKPTAYRAVANANGANQLGIIIPCHRVIASDGTLGGFGGGLEVKKWLLAHEKQFSIRNA